MIKKSILNLINKAGYRVEKIIHDPVNDVNSAYQNILLRTTYAPWVRDEVFQQVYSQIKENTLVSENRCYELWQLAEQVAKLDGALMEVGVWKGGTSGLIAYKAKEMGIEEKVYMCDTFEGVVKATEKDSVFKGGEHSDASQEEVEFLLEKKLKLDNWKVLKGIFPDETAGQIPTETKFRFCHIDVDVYASAKDIIEWIWTKLVVGGIIIVDDYGYKATTGITDLIDKEERKKRDRIVWTNLTGHAMIIKIK